MLSFLVKEQVKTIIIKILYTCFKYFILIYKHEHIIIWLLKKLIMENSKYIQNKQKSIMNPLVPIIQLRILLNQGQGHFISICLPSVLLLWSRSQMSFCWIPGISVCICYELNCVPPSSLCWRPCPWCDAFWRRGLREVMRVRWGHEGGVLTMGSVPLWEETPEGWSLSLSLHPHLLRKGHMRTSWRRWPSVTQGESTHQAPTLLAPWA